MKLKQTLILNKIRSHFDEVGCPSYDPLELEGYVAQKIWKLGKNKTEILEKTVIEWANKFIEEKLEGRFNQNIYVS